MRLIVADAYGSGYLESTEHGRRELSADEWSEVDVRDTVHAGDTATVVRYRDDQREVVVAAHETYDIEYVNEDVIDVRTATDAADEIAAAIEGWGTDEARIHRASRRRPTTTAAGRGSSSSPSSSTNGRIATWTRRSATS